MQIFVKKITDQKTLAIEVEAETTINEIQTMVADRIPQFGGTWPPTLALQLGGVSLDPKKTVADYPIQKETTLAMGMAEKPKIWADPRPEVISVLRWVLNMAMDTRTKKRVALFIAVGSACESGKRCIEQQFPDCFSRLRRRFDEMFIILADDGFSGNNGNEIYDLDRRWGNPVPLKGVASMYHHDRHDAYLYVFPTNALKGEYDFQGCPLPTTLAGIPYTRIGRAIESTGGMLLAGNFFSPGATPYYLSRGYEDLRYEL